MSFQRSNFPVRLQQILSGGRAVIPSLKLETEPPPNVKAFIDRVIKSPLHEIDKLLSGFQWKYSKGNYHHWRALFLHFDTYFKTYLSCRKDLLLADNMLDEDIFPKHSILQILRVMQIILTNCHNKSSFDGLENFKLLLSSTDPDIIIATLETLSALVRINPSKLHGSGGKPIGCGSINSHLMSLAQGWGSKEEGLGLFSCVVANERSQREGCSYPLDIDENCKNNQYRLGSTLHFEFRSVIPLCDEKPNRKGQASSMSVIHIPDLHLKKEDDLTILKQCVEQYGVPLEHRFSLLTRIRYAHAFRSSQICSLYSRISILAFMVLVQSNDAHDELVSFFANEPEYTNELIRLVRSDESISDNVKALAMFALGAELAAYTSSHERARILSGSTVISAGGNRMVLLTVLQKAISSLNSETDPSSVLFVEALLQFFLLHVLSSSSSGSAVRGSGMIPPLLPLLQNIHPAHMHLVSAAVKALQKLMEYSNPAVSLLKDLGGVELLVKRLQIEVCIIIGAEGESSSSVAPIDQHKFDVDHLHDHKRLIKALLKALGSTTYSPASSTRSQDSSEKSLPDSLSLIFRNTSRFGGDIYFAAVTVMSEIIHKDPTCFPILYELGLPDAFLSSVVSGVLPSSKALICIPGALGAICLNAKGLEAVKEAACLQFLLDAFTTKKYLVAMNEGVVLLANAVEELLRHVSSLRPMGVDVILQIISKLAPADDGRGSESVGPVDEDTAMEMDVEDKDSRVETMESDSDNISSEQFVQLCIFHVMVLVHRTVENTETCRLFVEKKGIEALMRLLLQPCIAQSSEGMPVALHSTVVFKGFTQHHSTPLAVAFCSALRDHLNKALNGLQLASDIFLLNPRTTYDSSLFSPLFVIEFLLFLGACKDHRWVAAILTEFGNGSRDVLENLGRIHREVLWQLALLEDSKLEKEIDASGSEAQSSDPTDDSEEQGLNSIRQYIDPLLRRRVSGWSVESQFLDLISMYRDIGRGARSSRRMDIDVTAGTRLLPSSRGEASTSLGAGSVSRKEADKLKSYNSSCRDMMRSLSYHISHLFMELGKAMTLSSRRGSDSLNVSPSIKAVASIFTSTVVDHLNFRVSVGGSSPNEVSVSAKCRYLGKVVDFIDSILLEKPESYNPILLNCFYGRGVVEVILTTFEATSQLLFAVNKTPASPMETDNESSKQELKKETDNSWIYGPLASYGTLMDHLVTSSFIINSHPKQLLEQPIFNENGPFPRDPEAFVKILQSKVVRAVLPIWNHCNFTECNNEFVTAVISIMRHVYSGVEVRNIGSSNGGRASGPPPDESTISLITEMGFSRSRAEEALRQVGANSVELATDWLFSHPEEPEEDDELARALKLSLGNSGTSSNEALSSIGDTDQEIETAQLPPVDELLPSCVGLLQANESLAFPIKDLLLTISSQNDGEFRQNVLNLLIDRLRGSTIPDVNNKILLSALLHVLALILNEDTTACEVAYRSGLVNIALDHLSHWDPASCDVDKVNVPKWVTASFLAIDLMLQLESKLSSGGLDPEKMKTDAFNHQTSVLTGESKWNGLQFSSGATSAIEIDDKKRLMEIACKCIKYQLPSDTMHVVLQLCATLTKVHSVAVIFLELGGLPALLSLPTRSLFSGFDNVAAAIIRHILEDPHTLQQAMESEIRHSLAALSSRHSNGRVTPRNFVQSLSSIISRDPVVFMRAVQSICQIEMTGERPYIVLLKDREKDKMKERDKEKTMEKEKQPIIDSNIKNTKVHRKSPQSFTSAIELLLDSITMFVPSDKVADAVDGFLGPPVADMDIDSASSKGKGKAVDVAPEASKTTNQEASASLAKSVFILKLLTEIIWTYPSSINVLLRKDAEVSSSFAISQRGNSTHSGGVVFHHILHKFLPCSGTLRRDKKTDTDWRQKLTSRAKQFLVASSARSAEGRKRILIEVNNIFLEFINSSDGCITPDSNMHSFLDLLNDTLAARTPTGSLISTEASVTFIDVGLVQSLTRVLQMLDLDHADSPKLITGIIKALELVTKEHVHSADPNSTKGDSSVKASSDHNEQERVDNNGNTFQLLETSSQPDRNAMATDRVESLNANQTSGSSESIADDMDHERDLDGGFVPEAEDYFMHETSEAGGSADNNGIANVEIRFDIPRNVDNLDDEDDEMSGDEEEVDEDDDEEDDENNELEGDDAHHMSHPETDQDEHDIDEEEFDEDVLEEEEDDDDDEDGVILRLEEGINGINVFEQLDLLEQGVGNFPNETLRVMPLEVFESRRQDRNQSIYTLMGRAGRRGSSEHPLLTDPSLRNLPQQRQSDNTIDAAFSDRSLESAPSRLDAVFRSLRSGRHSHRFNMWVDDTRQRGGSNANPVPQGIEELLVSQLRRPTPEQTPEQVGLASRLQEEDESNRQGEPGVHLEQIRAEDVPTDGNLVISVPSSVVGEGDTTEAELADDHQLQGQDVPSSSEQVIDMQYERSDATGRDVEAVSLESGGSSATLGESLRSLDVEIGSADGHDDGGERQGDMHQVSRPRRLAGSTLPLGSRDMSLESVSEVPLPPRPSDDVDQGSTMEEHQLNRNAEAGSIDPTFLDALPEELRAEVLSAQQNQVAQSSSDQPPSTGEIDPEFLAALPPDIRAEVLAQQQAQRVHQSQELEGQPVEMDTVSIIATFPSDLREEVLLTSPDNVLASLTPALVAEANMLRERFAHRYHSGTLFGMYPRNRRGESSRRVDPGSTLERAGAAARRSLGTKIVEADGAPLVDTEALKAMVRLLRVVQPLYKGQLQRLLLNLCAHHETRSSLVRLFMDMLMLDVHDRSDSKSINTAAEPLYRLYACQSHIIYSRPQFSDGVPPLVSRRILETLTYLSKNHPSVAKLLLHLELPRPHINTVDHGRGKAIMTMDEDNSDRGMVDFSIVLLLSLLNQPLYLRSVAHLEQLLNLLEVVIANAQNDLSILNKKTLISEKNHGSEITLPDAPVDVDLSGSSAGRDATHFPTAAGVSNASDTRVLLLNLPQTDLRRLCSLLAREGLSDGAYSLVAEVLKKLVAIVPDHCHLFVTELASSVQTLSTSAMSELHMYEDIDKMLPSSSGDGTAILRVLLALSSLVTTLREYEKDIQLHIEKDQKDALSQVWSLNSALEPLWSELSNCISKIECISESTTDVPTNAPLSSTGVAPPLPAGTQNILPYIESFFVACEKLYPGQSGIVQEFVSATSTDIEDATTSTSAHKPGTVGKMEEKNVAFVRFSEKHRKTLNAFVRQNPGLLEKSFSLMLKVPRFIDFDNKRAHFRSKIKHQHDHHHSSLRISVRRAYILEDSYNQLRMRSPQDLKGRLTVHFQGEEGIDAGGLTREWYQLLSRVVFDKGALLFTTVGNEATFQPNPNSVYQTEHLSYFKFVGRVVGKALFDGQLLDVHFTRSFYKHILGVKVTYHDIEAIDPDYFKNLKWMLENDISDVLGLTFSIDADEEKLILYERAEVTDYELIPGGRNIRVTEENKQEYVDLVAEHRLTTAIRPQINAFMEGFNDLIPKDLISIFNDKELELLISGLPDIDLDDLRMNTEYSGYSNASPVIQWFWEVVQGLSKEDKARLLQFVTGTSKVPLDGFSALQGISGSQRFQIHKAYGSANHLPSAHTCFNQLDLPEYPSKEQLQERLLLAIHEASEGFGFG